MTGSTVDLTARDRAELLALMLAEIRARVPGWQPESVADIGVTFVELLASVADRLSYDIDAAGTEAYLGRARQRRSAVRHARLLGVDVDEGSNARTWVHLEIDDPGATDDPDTRRAVTLPAGTTLLTRLAGQPKMLASHAAPSITADLRPVVFETMHEVTIYSDRNAVALHADEPGATCVTAGATQVALCGVVDLEIGDALAIGVPPDGQTVDETHVVRVTDVSVVGRGDAHPVTLVEWDSADAPPDVIRVRVQHDGDGRSQRCRSDVRVLGNLVLADHGATSPVPVAVERTPGERARWWVRDVDLTVAEPASSDPRHVPARSALERDVAEPVPALVVVDRSDPAGRSWHPVRDLLESDRFARHLVAERTGNGDFELRFGDGRFGAAAPDSVGLVAHVRLGGGTVGNVAAGAIGHLVIDVDALPTPSTTIRPVNLVAATGGRAPETLERIRQRVPHAWSTMESCVTPADVASVATRHPQVRAASARRISADSAAIVTTALTLQLRDDGAPRHRVEADVLAMIEPQRVIGHVIEVRAPESVPIAVTIDVLPRDGEDLDVLAAHVRDAIASSISPKRIQLGTSLHRSEILSVVHAVVGVRAASISRFRRADERSDSSPVPAESIIAEPWELIGVSPTEQGDEIRVRTELRAGDRS